MRYVGLFLAGVSGGILGGMGFGGGTLLIPVLTFLLGVPYRTAVWTNLIVFLPTAVVALFVHIKNKMVDWRVVRRVLSIAILGLSAGIFLVGKVSERVMRLSFGMFLIAVGSCSLFFVLFGYYKRNTKK